MAHDDRGSDGDVQEHGAVVSDEAAGAAVGASARVVAGESERGFEFVDDLHRADFGRAGDGSGREGGPDEFTRTEITSNMTFDGGDTLPERG